MACTTFGTKEDQERGRKIVNWSWEQHYKRLVAEGKIKPESRYLPKIIRVYGFDEDYGESS
jgi:hypothetical protein